jgi:acyl-CoA dehydrogenase
MLLLMKSQTEAMRALAAVVAVSLDAARLHPRAEERERHQAFADLMIPVVKGWCTENSVDIASLGIQVHGGVGFVEETGAAQYLRDARITPIYEGTTGIQANDLIGRKLARDGGHAANDVITEMRTLAANLSAAASAAAASGPEASGVAPNLSHIASAVTVGVDALARAVGYVVENYGKDIRGVSVGAVPLLKLFGVVAGGWQLARSALISHRRLGTAAGQAADRAFHEAKIMTARFYADHVLSQAPGLAHSIVHGAAGALAEGVL